MDARDILIFLYIKNKGDWESLYNDLLERKDPEASPEEVASIIKDYQYTTGLQFITILDEEYPARLKHSYKPPIVITYTGDKSLLSESAIGFLGDETLADKVKSPKLFLGKDVIEICNGKRKVFIGQKANRCELARMFGSLATQLVLDKATDTERNNMIVMSAINMGADIYCTPTTKPSWTNTLIKQGAYLLDSVEDLK